MFSDFFVGGNSSEIRWAPHLVGIEFIRTSELVEVGLLVDAVKEGVSGLPAEFSVPAVQILHAHSGQVHFVLCQVRHSSNNFN